MITRIIRHVGTAVLAFGVALPGAMSLTASAATAPRDNDDRPGMEHVVKHRSPRSKQIQPYAKERKQRYTSESTLLNSAPPCAVLPPNRADWPASVDSCVGPPPKPTRQASSPVDAAPPATPPAVNSGRQAVGSGTGSGTGAAPTRGAPSCR